MFLLWRNLSRVLVRTGVSWPRIGIKQNYVPLSRIPVRCLHHESWDSITTDFNSFPYYLSPSTKDALILSTYAHLKRPQLASKFADVSSTGSARVLLRGEEGSEIYQEQLVRALAKHLQVPLLVFDPENATQSSGDEDAVDQLMKRRREAASASLNKLPDANQPAPPAQPAQPAQPVPPAAAMPTSPPPPPVHAKRGRKRRTAPTVVVVPQMVTAPPSNNSQTREDSDDDSDDDEDDEDDDEDDDDDDDDDDMGVFDAEMHAAAADAEYAEHVMGALRSFMDEAATHAPCLILLKDITRLMTISDAAAAMNDLLLQAKFSHAVVATSVMGPENDPSILRTIQEHAAASRDIARRQQPHNSEDESGASAAMFGSLFPIVLDLPPPPPGSAAVEFSEQLRRDRANLTHTRSVARLQRVLQANNMTVGGDLNTLRFPAKTVVPFNMTEQIALYALSQHLSRSDAVSADASTVELPLDALQFAIDVIQGSAQQTVSVKTSKLKDLILNQHEQKLCASVVSPTDIDIGFRDIGALEPIKQTLRELVMLPLRRPDLFQRGQLKRSVAGVLLFGPPGTGKTMLAKAVAAESGATFINVTMSELMSKWFGDGEKMVNALFSLANKVAPAVVFVDEIDSFLSARWLQEHDGTRRMKNEFLALWDGLASSGKTRVLIMGATNRPFDLDDAVLRRMPRRLLVDVPSEVDRKAILKAILKDELLDSSVDVDKLAAMTEGLTGSDLRDLTVTAAYRPVRDHLATYGADSNQGEGIGLRALKLEDFEAALKEVKPSVSEASESVTELRKWNDLYGRSGRGLGASKFGFAFAQSQAVR